LTALAASKKSILKELAIRRVAGGMGSRRQRGSFRMLAALRKLELRIRFTRRRLIGAWAGKGAM